jgi:hypothetical protein
VDWVMNFTGYSRERSIAACRELAERRVLMHVDRKKKFKDGRFFYRFQTVCAEDEDAFEEAMKEVEDQGRKIRAELASTRNNVRSSKDIWPLVSFSISRSTEESIEGLIPNPHSRSSKHLLCSSCWLLTVCMVCLLCDTRRGRGRQKAVVKGATLARVRTEEGEASKPIQELRDRVPLRGVHHHSHA